VTDGSAVPAGLTVNPAFTIAALAERAVPGIVAALRERGVQVTYGAPSPSGAPADAGPRASSRAAGV
jgi:choline dehydrogenase-like flavoprotein